MKKQISIIIISLLWLISIYSVIKTTTTSFNFNLSNYIAFGSLFIITILLIVKFKRINTAIGIVLLIGSFNIISFTYKTYSLTFGIMLAGHELNTIGIQPLSLVLLLLLSIADDEGARRILSKIFPKVSENEISNSNNQEALINIYKEKYKNYTIQELIDITSNKDSYQQEAIIAAEELLKEKNNNPV